MNFTRVSLQSDGKKSAQFVYFNHEIDVSEAMKTIFRHKTFDLPSPKLIILLKGGLNNQIEQFNERQFSSSVAKLLLDIGRNKSSNEETAPWLFTYIRHDSIASRIIQIAKQQYLANNIPLERFVNIGIDVCQSLPLDKSPNDYSSIVKALLNMKTESNRVLNKCLSRLILYGKEEANSIDRCSVLQECIQEILHLRQKQAYENSCVPKIVLLYGGDVHHAKSIYRLISIDSEEKQFGLVIVRGSGGLSDVLSWVCDKIRVCEMGIISKKLFDRELNVLVRQQLACEVDRDLLDLIEYLFSTQCKTVRVFDEDDDLSLSVLEAIVTTNQTQRLSSLKLQLSLAFDLNQPKFASRMLRQNQDFSEQDLIQLAKMAIIRDQVEFIHVIEDICGITSDYLGENFEYELSVKLNYNHALFLECIQENFGCQLDEIYRISDENNEHAEDEIQSINVRLFLWAVFFDHYKLSLHFWRRLNDRLCGALIAARVYRHTAELCIKRSSTETITIEKLNDHANEYENLAVRLLQSLYVSNPDMARLAIKRENFEFNRLISLEVAIQSQSEHFIEHVCVQEVFDSIWCGEQHRKIHGKYFDRMLTTNASSFGQASTGISAKVHQNFFKSILTRKCKFSRPIIKYQIHFIFYIIFLILLSYLILFVKVSLVELNEQIESLADTETCTNDAKLCSSSMYSEQPWSVLQTIVNIWVFMFAFEEFRQIKSFKRKDIGIFQTFMIYLGESWNKLDCLCIIMYILSIILESYHTKFTLNASRAFLALDVVLWFIRLLVLLMIDRTIGPMLLMIQAMLRDMTTFCSMFFVFTSAYGVASYALLKSGEISLDFTIFRRIFHQAYWHLFGQINDLDEIEDNFQLTGWTAFMLLAFYMAISNILLVNILVATFSNTFDRMYSKMDTLWKFHRYHIIKEYTILSNLPPPFNLFNVSNSKVKPFSLELTNEQIENLRRREALAYESNIFEQANKINETELNRQEKFDVHLRQLKKLMTHVKITCEATANDI